MRVTTIGSVVAVMAVMAAPGGAAAAWHLDKTFGSHGATYALFGQSAGGSDVGVQGTGKIVVGGFGHGGLVARWTKGGRLDRTFGHNGSVQFGDRFTGVTRLAIQHDGSILAAGSGPFGVTAAGVARLARNGAVAHAFGQDGIAWAPLGSGGFQQATQAQDILLLPDGKIAISGYATATDYTSTLLFAARFTRTGHLDGSFGSGGTVTHPAPAGFPNVSGRFVVRQASGKLVVGGVARSSDYSRSRFIAMRLNPNGTVDHSFGHAGFAVITPPGGGASLASEAVRVAQDKLVIAGSLQVDGAQHMGAIRLTRNGAVDHSFGTGGAARVKIGTGGLAYDVALQRNGKLVLAGVGFMPVQGGSNSRFAIARLTPGGRLDSGFGAHHGWIAAALPGSIYSYGGGVAPAGERLVVAGSAGTPADRGHPVLGLDRERVALARYSR